MLSANEPLADNTRVDRDQIARLIRWTLVLGAEAVLVASLLSARHWYEGAWMPLPVVLGSAPLLGYLAFIESRLWSFVTGLALLALTLWTGLGFAHVPASSRDGAESTLFFLNVIFGVPLLVAGVLLEWLSPRSLRRRRTSSVS
jgi:hypothetical protein